MRLMKWIKSFWKKIVVLGVILSIVGFFMFDVSNYFTSSEIQNKVSNILNIILRIMDDLQSIRKESYSTIKCDNLQDWDNKDMNLNVNYNSQIVSLKENRDSGLIFFKNEISRRIFVLNEFELGEARTPNLVLYFTDKDKPGENPFRVEIGSGDPRVVMAWYKGSGRWKEAEELDGLQRLPQPIAPGSELIIRTETTPDDGHRTIKLKLSYQPGNNPNASREDANFTFRFPVEQQPFDFNFALGLINPKLLSDFFSFRMIDCKYQEIRL